MIAPTDQAYRHPLVLDQLPDCHRVELCGIEIRLTPRMATQQR